MTIGLEYQSTSETEPTSATPVGGAEEMWTTGRDDSVPPVDPAGREPAVGAETVVLAPIVVAIGIAVEGV